MLIPVLAEITAKSLSGKEDREIRQRIMSWFLAVVPGAEAFDRWHEWEHLSNHLQHVLAHTPDVLTAESSTEENCLPPLLSNFSAYLFRRQHGKRRSR